MPDPIAEGTVDVMAGRVATLTPSGEDVVGVRIVSGVDHGTVTVNPDNTLALVMTQSEFTGSQSFTYEAIHADGSTSYHQVGLNVTPGAQDGGWGTGENQYILATDADGRVIVEHGDIHTKVYVSNSDSALSRADIAAMEGISVDQVTGDWLAAHGGYGQSEGMALNEEAGMLMWRSVTPRDSETSNWLLFERGYSYTQTADILPHAASAESAFNPRYVGAWGEGDQPVMEGDMGTFRDGGNIVFQDLHFNGLVDIKVSENVLFDHVTFNDEVIAMEIKGVTFLNSSWYDIYTETAPAGMTVWEGFATRSSGLYVEFSEGVLIDGAYVDQVGWTDDFLQNGSTSGGPGPSPYSHNFYINTDNTDVTVSNSIIMRSGGAALVLRGGGYVHDNAFIDNNYAISFEGGKTVYTTSGAQEQGAVGHYTLFAENVITSALHETPDATNYMATTLGIRNDGELSSIVDNIAAHLADPNNPAELADKAGLYGLAVENVTDPLYDNTMIYNWVSGRPLYSWETGSPDANVSGLDTSVLDQTTIQNFTAQLLGDPDATVDDLANYLRAQANGAFDNIVDAELINRFFQQGFGMDTDIRDSATTVRFVPDDLGEGVRWDNTMNWSTGDLPGLYPDDDVDLGGNHVVTGASTTIDTLDMGPGGALSVYGGRLEIAGGITGSDSGSLNVNGVGQVWTEGSDASDLDITVTAGRFANTGLMQNADLTVTGGQAILAAEGGEFDLGTGRTLSVSGGSRVGFDGDNGSTAILDMHDGATLSFGVQDGQLGSIAEFRSGAYGDAPDVQSGIDLGNSTLQIDLNGLSASAGTAFTLMDADEIVGLFDDAAVGGLGARNATIVIDYVNDSVTLQLSAGNGAVNVQTVGDQGDTSAGEQGLWDALTAGQDVLSETAPAMLPEVEEIDPLLAA